MGLRSCLVAVAIVCGLAGLDAQLQGDAEAAIRPADGARGAVVLPDAARLDRVVRAAAPKPLEAPVRFAEDKQKKRFFLNFFFGKKKAKPRKRLRLDVAPSVGRKKALRKRPTAPKPIVPVIKAVPKAPNAKVFLVMGDTMAQGLSKALEKAFAEEPGIVIKSRIRGSSGFVRVATWNWRERAEKQLDKMEKVDGVIMMVGINDGRSFRVDGQRIKIDTPEWTALYNERIRDYLRFLQERRLPVIWVGLPPMSRPKYSRRMNHISSIFQEQTFQINGTFIDVWDAFVAEDGSYTSRGPDLQGKVRRLRYKDGIHFTRRGNEKLAYFVEQAIRADISGLPVAAAPDGLGETELTAAPKGNQPGKIVSLTNPRVDTRAALLGGAPADLTPVKAKAAKKKTVKILKKKKTPPAAVQKQAETEEGKTAKALLARGEVQPEPQGRVTDFRWPDPAADTKKPVTPKPDTQTAKP